MAEYINYDDLPDPQIPFDWDSAEQVGDEQIINIPDGRIMTRKLFKDKNGQLMGEDSYSFTLLAKPLNQ